MSAAKESAEWIERGRSHQWEGRPVDAMLCFRRASRADPAAPAPYFVLGEVLWQLGRLPDAVSAWREASRLAASYLAPWQAISEALLATGDGSGAREAAERVLSLAPGNARAAVDRWDRTTSAYEPRRRRDRRGARSRAGARARCRRSAGRSRSRSTGRRSRARSALLARFARAPEPLATAPLLLTALAVEHAATDTGHDAPAVRAALASMSHARVVAPAGSRRLAAHRRREAGFDAAAAAEFAASYAAWCASSLAPELPPGWPRRVAGDPTRVSLLVAGRDLDSAAARRDRRSSA